MKSSWKSFTFFFLKKAVDEEGNGHLVISGCFCIYEFISPKNMLQDSLWGPKIEGVGWKTWKFRMPPHRTYQLQDFHVFAWNQLIWAPNMLQIP